MAAQQGGDEKQKLRSGAVGASGVKVEAGSSTELPALNGLGDSLAISSAVLQVQQWHALLAST